MPLEIGALLNNRYRIERVLGQGGFGAVYLAQDEDLGIPCAVKENLNTSPQAERQFRREATLLATLRHPHLPRVTNHFVLGGEQYLVMDFIEGDDLKQRLDAGGPLPVAEALRWVEQMCDALAYLHSLTPPVIHRDIKPANIKITPGGEAVLVDFGIAKLAESGQKTTTGAAALTSGYAPPEQYQLGNTDGRTDEYALAATLYHLVTGRVPPDSVERLIGQAVLTPAEALRPELPLNVTAALRKALEIRPENRFRGVVQFRDALRDDAFEYTEPVEVPQADTLRPELAQAPTQTPTLKVGGEQMTTGRAVLGGLLGLFCLLMVLYLGAGLAYFFIGPFELNNRVLAYLQSPTWAARTPVPLTPRTPAPTSTEFRTRTPVPPTPTATPTSTATSTSTPTPTATLAPISGANASGLRQIARWGDDQVYTAKWESRGAPQVVAWSSDGRYLAVTDGVGVHFFDGDWLRPVSEIAGAFWRSFGPPGQALVTRSSRPEIVDIASGQPLRTITLPAGISGHRFALSPDGATLAIAGQVASSQPANGLALLSISDGLLRTLDDGNSQFGNVDSLAYTADGQMIVMSYEGECRTTNVAPRRSDHTGAIAIWNHDSGSLVRPPVLHAYTPKLSADGRLMAYYSGRIYIEEILTGATYRQIEPNGFPYLTNDQVSGSSTCGGTNANPFDFAPGTAGLYYFGLWNLFRWDQKGGPPEIPFDLYAIFWEEELPAPDYRLGFRPTGQRFYSIHGGEVRLRDLATGRVIKTNYTNLALSPDGRTAALPHVAGVDILDLESGQIGQRLSDIQSAGQIKTVAYLTDTVFIQKETVAELWTVSTGSLKLSYAMSGQDLVISPAGDLFAIRQNRQVALGELTTGRPMGVLQIPKDVFDFDWPVHYQFSPDSHFIAITRGRNVEIFDTQSLRREQRLSGSGTILGALAFTPDSTRLISTSGEVWSLESGTLSALFKTTSPLITVSPDGTLIMDGEGQLWNAHTGLSAGSLNLAGVAAPPRRILFTSDGRRLVWQDAQGVLTVIGVRP